MNDETGEQQDAVSDLLTRRKVMAISTHFDSAVANKDLLLEECNMMSPSFLKGMLPAIPAIPIRRG
eukprot:5573921-Prorocentrum_lima.AAC.1